MIDAHSSLNLVKQPDQSFYNTAADDRKTHGANPLYAGAMASVDTICEIIIQTLKL